jgi:hypothetical protein
VALLHGSVKLLEGLSVLVAPEKKNRRKHKRYKTDAHVLVIPENEEHQRFWASADNISSGGMFINTSHKLPLYSELRAKIVPREGGVSVHATARVVRESEGTGVGCCFVHMAENSSFWLNQWLGRTGGLPSVSGTIAGDWAVDTTPPPETR